jgi:hypothetical protein
MKPRIVPFARGAHWLLAGWRLFRVAPLGWLTLVFAYWLAMTAVSLVPVLGVVVAMVLVPGLSVGFMSASRHCEQGKAPELRQLVDGFRERRGPQLGLGVMYLLALALLLAATTLADDGALARWMLVGARPADDVLQSEGFFAALVVAAGFYIPVMMLFWFAPLLVAWHALPAAQALFYSFFASLLNWRAFLGYGLATAVVTLVIPLLALGAILVTAEGPARGGVLALAFPLMLLLLPVLFASFYASYRDVFGGAEGQ